MKKIDIFIFILLSTKSEKLLKVSETGFHIVLINNKSITIFILKCYKEIYCPFIFTLYLEFI